MDNILKYWPFPYEPRPNQVEALEWLAKQEVKYLFLEAPVGSGKSNIGITYSHFLGQRTTSHRGDSFILTPQRILQDQYEKSFLHNEKINLASLYGKSNFTCRVLVATCEIGSIVKPKCRACPFAKAKKRAQSASDTVLNYKLALTSFAFALTFKQRKLIVLDECHTLEGHLINFDALQITEARCERYKIKFRSFKETGKALEWMKDYYVPELRKVVGKIEAEIEPLFEKSGDEITRSEINKIRELNRLHDHFDEATAMSLRESTYVDEKFVLVWDKKMFQFKRLKGAYSFYKHVVPFAEKFLFMSSTILNKEGFCEDLGIPPEETAYLSLDSEFPTEKRPVYYMPQMKMNARWKEPEQARDRKVMLETVEKLLEIHTKDTGIIHTGNFQIAEWLVRELDFPHHRVYHHNPDTGDDRNSVITAFTGDPKPSLLISPSSTEGLDLKDDLGRFAIFVKVGFPYLGDQWIKRRMELSNEWYFRRTLIDMIQGSGRIVRSDTDWGSTYILDASFAYLRKNAHYMMPSWWKDSFHSI